MRRNWKFLLELLAPMNPKCGAEIGVFKGDCTVKLLEGLPSLEWMVCVDPWENYEGLLDTMPVKHGEITKAAENNFEGIQEEFMARTAPWHHKMIIVPVFSKTAAEHVEDDTFDFVFIDGNHSYHFVKEDILLWRTKVIKGGVICGHDYVDKPGYGVIQAVQECFGGNFFVDKASKVWYATAA